jgi:hypothetical protein
VRVATLDCTRISSARAASGSGRRATNTTFTPSAAIWRENAAPVPSEAPATIAHGP